jgi:NAD(P)-dependent dehydrogenase (short-subunit alcohol dehydrogenase family)
MTVRWDSGAIADTVAHHGRFDLLVNNAGATKRADFFALTEEDWHDGFTLKFHGYVRMTRAAWAHLRQSNGSIVNIIRHRCPHRIGRAYHRRIGQCANDEFAKAIADVGMPHGVCVDAINPDLWEADRFVRNIVR